MSAYEYYPESYLETLALNTGVVVAIFLFLITMALVGLAMRPAQQIVAAEEVYIER